MSPRPTSTPDTRGYTTRDFNGLCRLRWNASELIAEYLAVEDSICESANGAQIVEFSLGGDTDRNPIMVGASAERRNSSCHGQAKSATRQTNRSR